jgi:selenocysteine-specific elongation factor
MHVLATAGHVDHGKSTLVRALTGMEPDRWAEERRRGMTIDLGYAWTTLPTGEQLAFVDVPGHERFIGNMLAGLGPAPGVLFVVAADEGWCAQSAEHLAAIDALGLSHAVLAVTRSDLADPGPATAEALTMLERSSLGRVRAVQVSATTSHGLADLRRCLSELVGELSIPDPTAPVRLWVDRAFTMRGVGTVVTGTLGTGALTLGDELVLADSLVKVRGLQTLGAPQARVEAAARVAVNLRGVERDAVGRGAVLLTPGAWRPTSNVDVRLSTGDRLPEHLVMHVGSTAVTVRVRRLGDDIARLQLASPLVLTAGDRALLRDPAAKLIVAGLVVLDADPPTLRRRGAGAARAEDLNAASGQVALLVEVVRRGCVATTELRALGVSMDEADGVRRVGDWWVSDAIWARWVKDLVAEVDRHAITQPLLAGLSAEAARRAIGAPDLTVLIALVRAAGLEHAAGRVRRQGALPHLGIAEAAVVTLEQLWAAHPFAAPSAPELAGLGLGPRQLAAAETAGRLFRLAPHLVLPPSAAALALEVLASLPQPFTVSDARLALSTSRRVAVPLLEHLDRQGGTVRLDGALRRVASR